MNIYGYNLQGNLMNDRTQYKGLFGRLTYLTLS